LNSSTTLNNPSFKGIVPDLPGRFAAGFVTSVIDPNVPGGGVDLNECLSQPQFDRKRWQTPLQRPAIMMRCPGTVSRILYF
jgi:hypothetical protein